MRRLIYIITAVFLALVGKLLLQGDYILFLQWWVTIAGLGILCLPVSSVLFEGFHDKGYLFAKALGVAVCGYIMWLLSSLQLVRFTSVSCIVCTLIVLILNGVVLLWQKKEGRLPWTQGNTGKLLDAVVMEELLFFGVFLFFTYIRCFKPEAYGTEKFMDYGFMTSMMRSDYMPPQDFWFSGTKLNYYYVGQYMATFLTKLSFSKVSNSYNLMLMMVGAFAFVLPYSLVYNVALQFVENQEKKNKLIPTLSGLVAGIGVCIAGNMHYPTYQWFEPIARKFFGMEASEYRYWFPDATRFIGYHPDTPDKTIHEFPAYSFVLGDLHAHVINIMFVLTILGILYAWLMKREPLEEKEIPVWKEVCSPSILAVTFLIGLFHTTNFWDFPIYYVVSGAVILFSNLIVYNFKVKAFWLTAIEGVFVYVGSEIVCLPFTLDFDQISTLPLLAESHTALNQLIILWGLPVFVVISFLAAIIFNHRRETQKDSTNSKEAVLACFMKNLSASDLYMLVLGLCAIGLVLMPELIYIQDIYSGEYKRANTMFKLTYQSFIMFGLCFGYILLRQICYGRTKRQRKYAWAGMLLFLLSVTYIQNAVSAWYGNIFQRDGYKGLDAAAFMEDTMPEDVEAIQWLNDNVSGTPVVLEANGGSYSDYERVSVMTGLPTILGWHDHEWLWKGDTSLLDERDADITKIYTSTEEAEVRALLQKYKVSYIYVGKLEQEKYTYLNHELIRSLGEVVFDRSEAGDTDYGTYIVQVNN
jgi:uncharacterized membrane protein